MSHSMKLAASTIYLDNDLTIPTTCNSIIAAKRNSRYGIRCFYVLLFDSLGQEEIGWRSHDLEIPIPVNDLHDIVIIYRAPLEGVGLELIEEIHSKNVEETLEKLESYLTRGVKRVIAVTRNFLEVE